MLSGGQMKAGLSNQAPQEVSRILLVALEHPNSHLGHAKASVPGHTAERMDGL